MYGGLARFVVKPGKREEFLELVRWSARVARDEEPGTMIVPFSESVASNAD